MASEARNGKFRLNFAGDCEPKTLMKDNAAGDSRKLRRSAPHEPPAGRLETLGSNVQDDGVLRNRAILRHGDRQRIAALRHGPRWRCNLQRR